MKADSIACFLDGMKWDDVRSSVIFHLSSRAPAALGFPVESILNAFFGATDSSGPRFSGLNINLLDNAHGVPALSKSEYNEIWDWAVSFYRLHQNDPSVSLLTFLIERIQLT